MSIQFDAINDYIAANARLLFPQWFPHGKWSGGEFKIGDTSGKAGDSLSVSVTKKIWQDFASGEHGDLIALYAAHRNIGQADAARELAPHLANGHDHAPISRQAPTTTAIEDARPDPVSEHETPEPSGPPTITCDVLYRYTDRFYVARRATATGKTFTPLTWDGETWQHKAPPKPRPLFNLDELNRRSTAVVLVVEGEKAAQAAAQAISGYVVVTWAGGANSVAAADWSPLTGRTVDIWPDADEPGRKAALKVAETLHRANATAARVTAAELPVIRIVDTTDAPSEGWDIADAITDGWTPAKVIAWGKERIKAVTPVPAEVKVIRKQPAATTDQPHYVLWEQCGLKLAHNGQPHSTADNVVRALSHLSDFTADSLWYDEFRERILTTWRSRDGRPREWTDDDDAVLMVHMQRALEWHNITENALQNGLRAFLQTRRRNPLLEYLDSLTWDGEERLASFLSSTYGTPQDDYHAAVGRCWLTSMIARAYRPGCQVDTIPVLEGAQGIRKSTSLEILGGEFYCSMPRGFGDIEFLLVMEGCWLGEIPDMASFRGRDLDHIKAFITIREDRYRRKFGKRAITRLRQCVFAATDNGGDWNADVTGARRFWPIACRKVDIEYLCENRDQLLAEAKHRFESGEPWWDVPVVAQKEMAEHRRTSDPWEEIIERYVRQLPRRNYDEIEWFDRLQPLAELSVNDLLTNAIGLPIGRCDRSAQMRVVNSLKALGYSKIRRKVADQRHNAYVNYSPEQE